MVEHGQKLQQKPGLSNRMCALCILQCIKCISRCRNPHHARAHACAWKHGVHRTFNLFNLESDKFAAFFFGLGRKPLLVRLLSALDIGH